MSSIVKNVRQKMKRTVSHKDPEGKFNPYNPHHVPVQIYYGTKAAMRTYFTTLSSYMSSEQRWKTNTPGLPYHNSCPDIRHYPSKNLDPDLLSAHVTSWTEVLYLFKTSSCYPCLALMFAEADWPCHKRCPMAIREAVKLIIVLSGHPFRHTITLLMPYISIHSLGLYIPLCDDRHAYPRP